MQMRYIVCIQYFSDNSRFILPDLNFRLTSHDRTLNYPQNLSVTSKLTLNMYKLQC